MKNILLYDDFINEDIINEGLLDGTKNRIKDWWKSFQNKEEFIRKFSNYYRNGFYTLASIYLIYVIFYLTNDDVSNWAKNDGKSLNHIFNYVYYAIWMIYIFAVDKFSLKFRKKLIEKKVSELKDQFINHSFKDSIFMVIGDRKNIDLALNKLKRDRILNDDGILQTKDVTLIDLTEKFKNEIDNSIKEIDPFGEENWNEDGTESEHTTKMKSLRKKRMLIELSVVHDVQFRQITDISDLNDKRIPSYSKKYKKENEESYKAVSGLYKKDYGVYDKSMEEHKIILRNAHDNFFQGGLNFLIGNTKFLILRVNEEEDQAYAYPVYVIPKEWIRDTETKIGNMNGYIRIEADDIVNYYDGLFDKYQR